VHILQGELEDIKTIGNYKTKENASQFFLADFLMIHLFVLRVIKRQNFVS